MYRLGIALIKLATRIAASFSAKARLRIAGAERTLPELGFTDAGQFCFWMHCASVGEFEQGRPLWRALQARRPDARFVLTFFSPSGGELFRGKPGLGEVHYLPWDDSASVAGFAERLFGKGVDGAAGGLALFVKYEWWLGYHRELARRAVPVVLVSGAFRQNQPFFQTWHPLHRVYREALVALRFAFVQSEESCLLLQRAHYATACLVTGDTRLDRTLDIRDAAFEDEWIEAWTRQQSLILVAGSTWPADEVLLQSILRDHPNLSLLIAPHELGAATKARIEKTFALEEPLFYSDSRQQEIEASSHKGRVMILDTMGLLSRVYRFGQLAYVGGGFGAGIHNTLEAAVYGLPVAFGPKHQRFVEAGQLKELGLGYAVTNAPDLSTFVARFASAAAREAVLAKAEAYTQAKRGATARILRALEDADLL